LSKTAEEIAAEQAAQAAAAAAAAKDGDDDDDDDDLKDADAEKLREQLRASRRNERQLKRQHGATTKELETLKQGQMSEAERIQKERDEAIAERDRLAKAARERDARDQFVKEAQAANALRPEALFRLADDLEYDDDGKPTNIKPVITQLRKDYPELFGAAGSADGASGRGGAATGTSVSDQMRRQLGRG
jgi:hypothetical protein